MVRRIGLDMSLLSITSLDTLDRIPELARNEGSAIIVDGEGAEFENADIKFVAEKGTIGIQRSIKTSGFADL